MKDWNEPERRALQQALAAWFSREARDLPWRRTRDPYAIWVSEIMLQQTRIDQGTPYFERFMTAFPTVQALASANEDAVLKVWEGLGYYSRARHLHEAARLVVRERGGVLPKTAKGWQALPGVGRYTAGAISSIAFGERVAVLDGNVKRVLARLFDVTECIDVAAVETRLWALAESLVPETAPGDFNQAMMELGAQVCTPKTPKCAACPANDLCAARAAGVQEQRPVRKPKASPPHREFVVAAVCHRGRYLIAKRPGHGLLGGLWEFPGAEVSSGESHQETLTKVLAETFGLEVKVGGLIAVVQHAYTHFRVTLDVYRCEVASGTPVPTEHTEVRWVRPAHFDHYPFPKAHLKFRDLL